jgi:putative solute:sodium symporter small subunit
MDKSADAYWSATLKLLLTVLAVWFLVGYVLAILLAQPLNAISLGGYPLGFWISQQGSMYVFVALIFIFARAQGKIDERFDVHEE